MFLLGGRQIHDIVFVIFFRITDSCSETTEFLALVFLLPSTNAKGIDQPPLRWMMIQVVAIPQRMRPTQTTFLFSPVHSVGVAP